jgi:hypothetical protein
MAKRIFFPMAPTLPSIFSTEANMKRARRYAAMAVYTVLFVALAPLAIVKILLDSFFEFCIDQLDFLEAVADDE